MWCLPTVLPGGQDVVAPPRGLIGRPRGRGGVVLHRVVARLIRLADGSRSGLVCGSTKVGTSILGSGGAPIVLGSAPYSCSKLPIAVIAGAGRRRIGRRRRPRKGGGTN